MLSFPSLNDHSQYSNDLIDVLRVGHTLLPIHYFTTQRICLYSSSIIHRITNQNKKKKSLPINLLISDACHKNVGGYVIEGKIICVDIVLHHPKLILNI